jgi:hypothetical protein
MSPAKHHEVIVMGEHKCQACCTTDLWPAMETALGPLPVPDPEHARTLSRRSRQSSLQVPLSCKVRVSAGSKQPRSLPSRCCPLTCGMLFWPQGSAGRFQFLVPATHRINRQGAWRVMDGLYSTFCLSVQVNTACAF